LYSGNGAIDFCVHQDDFFFSFLTDFSYFPRKKKFQKLQDMIRTGQKYTF